MTETTGGRVLADSNVLVYAYDLDEPLKQGQAAALLSDLMSAGRLILSAQCLNEFFNTVTNKKKPRPLPADEAKKAVRSFIAATRPHLRV